MKTKNTESFITISVIMKIRLNRDVWFLIQKKIFKVFIQSVT